MRRFPPPSTLEANPTRNRALDMLPLFAHVVAARVYPRVQDEHIKSRPNLHYRLPNSEVDRPGRDLDDAWDGSWSSAGQRTRFG